MRVRVLLLNLLDWFAALFLLCCFLLWTAFPLHAQRTNTFYVDQFAGNTVGEKTVKAQAACSPLFPCVLIFDPSLAVYATGAMPGRGINETWLDYRTPTGSVNLSPPVTMSDGGNFVNGQLNKSLSVNVNMTGTADATEMHVIGGPGADSTSAVSAYLKVPASATVFQGNAMQAFAVNASGVTPTVGMYTSCHSTTATTANNGACWGYNTVVYSSSGLPATLFGAEFDVIPTNVNDTVYGVDIQGISTAISLPSTPPNSFGIYLSQIGFQNGDTDQKVPWNYGIFMDDRSAVQHFIGASGKTSAPSQPIFFNSRDAGGVAHAGKLQVLANGQFRLTAGAANGTILDDAVFSPTFVSLTANPATVGQLKLAKSDVIAFRNEANTANVTLAKDTNDRLQASGGFNANNAGITNVGVISGVSGGSAGKAMCWKTATTLGYCSTVIDASGGCTCN